MAEEVFPNQTIIERAIIRKIDGSELDLLSRNQGNTPFFKLMMRESLFDPMVIGTLFVQDKGGFGEKLNFVGGEIFEIDVRTPLSDEDDLEFPNDSLGRITEGNLFQSLRFYIHKVRSLTDEGTLMIDSEKGPATMWDLELAPYEMVYFNKTDAPLYEGEFIGKIAGENGFVDYLADKYFSPSSSPYSSAREDMDIEPTGNSIWFKGNAINYPWSKKNSYLELGQVMNHLSENSVSEDNVSAANYLFWQDLVGWHFRSVNSLIDSQDGSRKYKVSFDKAGKDKIQSFRISKQIDQSELLNSDAYKAFYTCIEPNYEDVYGDYMPTQRKLKKQRIEYDYRTDYDRWSHVESNPVLPESLDYEDTNSNEKTENIYGWFNLGEYNDQMPTKFDYVDNDSYKNSMKAWQTMFDITDLDAEVLKKIRNEVILPAKENYTLYANTRLIKEKWNVYKYSICCDKQAVQAVETGGGGARILGWITGFERFTLPEDTDSSYVRQIWKYNWVPVEVWPKEEISNYEELQQGNTYEIVAEQGPFAVVKIPQADGITLEAWNMNELNNDYIPSLSIGQEAYLGPGYNDSLLKSYFIFNQNSTIEGNVSSEHYMPVGGIIRLDTLEQISPQTNLTSINRCNIEYKGHLTEIFEIPSSLSILEKIEDPSPSENVYVFNVENNIDGACIPCVLGDIQEV